jgi:hypothetical protein
MQASRKTVDKTYTGSYTYTLPESFLASFINWLLVTAEDSKANGKTQHTTNNQAITKY